MIIYINSTYDQKAEEDLKLLVKKNKQKKNTLLKDWLVIKFMLLPIFKFQPPPLPFEISYPLNTSPPIFTRTLQMPPLKKQPMFSDRQRIPLLN